MHFKKKLKRRLIGEREEIINKYQERKKLIPIGEKETYYYQRKTIKGSKCNLIIRYDDSKKLGMNIFTYTCDKKEIEYEKAIEYFPILKSLLLFKGITIEGVKDYKYVRRLFKYRPCIQNEPIKMKYGIELENGKEIIGEATDEEDIKLIKEGRFIRRAITIERCKEQKIYNKYRARILFGRTSGIKMTRNYIARKTQEQFKIFERLLKKYTGLKTTAIYERKER